MTKRKYNWKWGVFDLMALKRYKKKLRYNEYYDMQKIIDELYRKSKENYNFYNLYDVVVSDENLLLAYRTI